MLYAPFFFFFFFFFRFRCLRHLSRREDRKKVIRKNISSWIIRGNSRSKYPFSLAGVMDHRSNRSSKIEAKNRAKSGPRSRKKGIRVQLSIPSTSVCLLTRMVQNGEKESG